MPEVDWSIISAIASSVTAIIAIIAPAITTVCTIRSQERIKKQELYSPRVYDALAEMSESFASLTRKDYSGEDGDKVYMCALEKFNCFSTACYKVLALIPDKDIHQKISRLLTDRQAVYPTPHHDALFIEIMADINAFLSMGKFRNWWRKKILAWKASKRAR